MNVMQLLNNQVRLHNIFIWQKRVLQVISHWTIIPFLITIKLSVAKLNSVWTTTGFEVVNIEQVQHLRYTYWTGSMITIVGTVFKADRWREITLHITAQSFRINTVADFWESDLWPNGQYVCTLLNVTMYVLVLKFWIEFLVVMSTSSMRNTLLFLHWI